MIVIVHIYVTKKQKDTLLNKMNEILLLSIYYYIYKRFLILRLIKLHGPEYDTKPTKNRPPVHML